VPRNVLLVGSVPLKDADEVFVTVGHVLGDRLRRVPDGETGDRRGWIRFQEAVVANNPQFELATTTSTTHAAGITFRNYRMKPGVCPDDINFGSLGYFENAAASYALFKRHREAGRLPASARFQVTMPTPLAFLWSYITPAEVAIVAPAYTKRVKREVAAIAAAVPSEDLAFQWDTVHELIVLEGARHVALPSTLEDFASGLAGLAAAVPAAAELGFHFCYGDSGRKHSVDPKDTGLMVALANRLTELSPRPINYIHMPVPRERSDGAYFAPLAKLSRKGNTELYLGLVHLSDGLDGTLSRMRAAASYVSSFGIGTECGLGRRAPETILDLLALHRTASEAAPT
jgi:hypothetical protein